MKERGFIILLSFYQLLSCQFISLFFFLRHSNDELEEGDPGSDSDFEIDNKKEVRIHV